MQSVRTYLLEIVEEQKLVLPEIASIIHAEYDGGDINGDNEQVRLYVYGDHESATTKLTFYVFNTGHVLPDTFAGQHIRTLPMGDGSALHVFMKPPVKRVAAQRGKPVIAERKNGKAKAETNPNDEAADVSERGGDSGA